MRSWFLLPTAVCLLVLGGTASAQQPNGEPRLPPPAEALSPNEALVQRARALSRSGNHRESAAIWQTVAEREPLIASLARRESILAFIETGDLEPAFNGLTTLGDDAPVEVLLRAADAFRRARAFDRAATLYGRARQSAGRSPEADDAALDLADTLEQAGKPAEALVVYRDLRVNFRRASSFDASDAAVTRLSNPANGEVPLTEDELARIVDRLVSVAAFRRAVDVESAWTTQFPNSLRRTQIESSMVAHLYSLRANAEARSRGETFLKQYAESATAHEVYITLFRLDVREGRTVEVEARGRAIMSGNVQGATLEDRQGAARLLAEYLVSVGQPAKALDIYAQLNSMIRTRSGRVDVLWRTAIAALRAGQRAQAVKVLQQILTLKPDSETERATLFWLAYTQNASGSKTAAQAAWESLARNHPFTYYGIRAATWLKATPASAPLTFPVLELRPMITDHPDYRAAAFLSRAGLAAEAAVYARRLNTAFRRDDAVALLAARASEAAGDYTSASTLMSSYFGVYLQRPATNLPSDFWALAYPRAFWPEVSAAAARYNVDPLLMLGLSRQESHFDRTARSPVGAVGLFQIMPYTALELDSTFSNPAAMERLVQPAVSAELAAKLIASLQTRFQGALAPTIASYNADRERVQLWWDSAKGLPEELFIDSIPYQQTRAYVRQVITNYELYRRSAR